MTLISDTEIRHRQVSLRSTFSTALRSVAQFEVIEFVINGVHVGQTVATPAITGDRLEVIIEDLKFAQLVGREISDLQTFNEELQSWGISQSAKAAIDMALFSSIMGDFPMSRVRSDVTLPIASLTDYPKLILDRNDFDVFKIKLDRSPIKDSFEKIMVVREMRPDVRIRIDPNQSWSVEDSLSFLKALESTGIEIDYLEQPTPRQDFSALRSIKEESGVPVMADESCFTAKDLLSLIELDAIDYVNLKILKNGGMTEVLKLADMAKSANVQVSIGSMMEGELGIRAAAYLAANIAPDAVHDLDAAWWLTESSCRYQDGFIEAS